MKKKVKVLMIALQHSAKDDRIFYKQALSLFNNEYDVTCLLLGDKKGQIKDMGGNILNINNEKKITVDGIKIAIVKSPTDKLNLIFKKIFIGEFQKRFVDAIINEHSDIYHAHEPISLRFAIKASQVTKKKVIFDCHESWLHGTIKEMIIKRRYLKKIKYFITVNKGVLDQITNKSNIKISEIIYNTSLISLYPLNPKQEKINYPIQIVHEGSLTFNRGLKTMFNSILILTKQFPQINLKIIGSSPQNEAKFISNFILKNNLQKNITLLGYVDYKELPSKLKNCDIGLILYSPTQNNLLSTSNKLFNYIASGLAIISVKYLRETNKILKPLNNSLILNQNDCQELANKIKILIENPKLLLKLKNASVTAHHSYHWKHEEKKLLNFYKKVIND